MILRLRLAYFFVSLFLFTSFTAAWPWPPSYADIESLILRRQDSSKSDSTSASQTATQGSSAGSSQASQTASPSGSAAATSGESNSKSQSGSGSKAEQTGSKTAQTGSKKTGGSAAATSAQVTDVDPRLPAGGVNMLTPSALAQTTYYKIGETVTFAWNYTSLSISPSKIDVFVSCSANSATYTLSSNASFASTGSVAWDTQPDETGTAPLLTETYTLVIHDAAKDVGAVASAGQLGSYDQFHFGMYVRQSYTQRSDWTCAVCSAALSDTERQALKFMFGMATVTVLSFTWFVGGFGAFI